MARPTKRRVPGSGAGTGRTTPKGGAGSTKAARAAASDEGNSRYTAPVPSYTKSSPIWVPVLMFTFWGVGFLVILANYVGLVPGDTSNWYLLVGLGLILAGILTATQYR
jgi:hypothetical protein